MVFIRIILVIAGLFYWNLVSAGAIDFEKNHKTAFKRAQQEKKLVFVDFSATWCGPCRKLDETVFTNVEVADFFNSNYISAKLDEAKFPFLKEAWNIRAYPTLIFFSEEKEELLRVTGYMSPENLLLIAETVYLTEKEDRSAISKEVIMNRVDNILNELNSRFSNALIQYVFEKYPEYQFEMIEAYSTIPGMKEKIEYVVQNNPDVVLSKKIRDRYALIKFMEAEPVNLLNINSVGTQMMDLGFKDIEEVQSLLSAVYAFYYREMSEKDRTESLKDVYGKGFLLNYPDCFDLNFRQHVFNYLKHNDIKAEFASKLIETYESINYNKWDYLMFDHCAYAYLLIGNRDKATELVKKAYQLANIENAAYTPSISLLDYINSIEEKIK